MSNHPVEVADLISFARLALKDELGRLPVKPVADIGVIVTADSIRLSGQTSARIKQQIARTILSTG